MEKEIKQKLVEKITTYHNSNDIQEKKALKKEILDMAKNLNLNNAFKIAITAHYEAFENSSVKMNLQTMLHYLPE